MAQMDYCPAFLKEVFTFEGGRESRLDCTDVTLNGADFTAGGVEEFGWDSRCVSTGFNRPYCLRTYCDAGLQAVVISAMGLTVVCDDRMGGDIVSLPWTDPPLDLKCPPLAAVCPDLICPANCAARGVCDWGSGGGGEEEEGDGVNDKGEKIVRSSPRCRAPNRKRL